MHTSTTNTDTELVKNALRGIILNARKELWANGHFHNTDEKTDTRLDKNLLDPELGLLLINLTNNRLVEFPLQFHPQFVALLFCLKGDIDFFFPEMEKKVRINNGEAILISHPYAPFSARIVFSKGVEAVLILTTIQRMHDFFNTNLDMTTMSREELKKYYDPSKLFAVTQLQPQMLVAISQLVSYSTDNQFQKMYYNGKVLEILSLYFSNAAEKSDIDINCPFLENTEDVSKIRKAKQVMLDNMLNPPSIKALSKMVELNTFKLKKGFKEVYGNTIYGFLNDYKMSQAMIMLEKRQHTVNEVAFAVGYANPSNFIMAFKKKYKVTPKKYLMELRG